MKMKYFVMAGLSLIIYFGAVHSSIASEGVSGMPFEAMTSTNIEQLIDGYMEERIGEENGAPGAAVIVVKDNKVLLKKGYGFADIEKQMKVDPDRTLFRVGSVTKTFTAAAVMQLVEQGKIELTADIQNYLGGIEIENSFNTPVTVHHLLTHTSGLAPMTDSMPYEDLSIFIPLESYIELRKPVVVREPGTSFAYDNYAYNLLGYIVERVSGQSYEEYMMEYIFEPLAMKNTYSVMREGLLLDLAKGYEGNNSISPYSMEPSELPSGGMITTAEDMGHFLNAQLNGGIYEDRVLWDDASITHMFDFQSSIHSDYPDASYGYENWLISEDKKGHHIVVKGGDIPGYSSFMMLLPEHRFGVFMVFNNLVSAAVEGRQWNKLFMDHYSSDIVPDRPEFLQHSRNDLKRLEGLYSDLRVYVVQTNVSATGNGELTVTDASGKRKLKQIEPLLFIDEEGEMLAFKEEVDGSIRYMKYRNPVSYSKKYISSFSDVEVNSQYLPFIEQMESMGIMKGRGNGQFQPREVTTRAEWTVLIGRILGIEAIALDESSKFLDTSGHWAELEIGAVTATGVIQGGTEGYFYPNQELTRQQAAEMLVPAILAAAPMILPEDISERVSLIFLADMKENEESPYTKTLVAAGLTGLDVALDEKGAYLFRPADPFTRQEAAVWINQFIHLYIQMLSES